MPGPDLGARFALELEGAMVGLLAGAEGGDISAPVVRDASTTAPFVRKHLGGVKYEDISLLIGLSLDGSIYDWISQSFAGKHVRKNGAVVVSDSNGHILQRRRFKNAAITTVSFPAMDAALRDPAWITLRISPEASEEQKASGPLPVKIAAATRPWLPANFRLDLSGLENSRIRRVDPFVVITSAMSATVADGAPSPVDFPDLRVFLAEAQASEWRAWFDDFVVKGNNDDAQTKAGSLAFLAPDLKTRLGSVGLEGVGIHRLGRVRQRSEDAISVLAADLYCEQMTFAVDSL